MMRHFLLFLLLLAGVTVNAQTASDSLQKGVDCDPRLQTLVNKHTEVNAEVKNEGYRVQIYFGGDKAKAREAKSRFLSQHADDLRAYEIYEAPNFKIRVGDFRTKLEAYRLLKEIKADFPSAFIVESEIEVD